MDQVTLKAGRTAVASAATMLVFLLALGFASPAGAYLIAPTGGTSGGNPGGQPLFQVSGLVEGDVFNLTFTGPTLLGTATITLFDIDQATDQVVLDIRVDNDSAFASSRLTAFGFGITPGDIDSTSLVDLGATDHDKLTLADTSNFPGFGGIEVCAAAGNNCAGGGNGGLLVGEFDLFRLTFHATSDITGPTITLTDFGIKIQSGPAGGSFELAGTPTPTVPPTPVPEPATLVLMGIGLLGLAATVRRSGRAR